jgi:hypothetical protein
MLPPVPDQVVLLETVTPLPSEIVGAVRLMEPPWPRPVVDVVICAPWLKLKESPVNEILPALPLLDVLLDKEPSFVMFRLGADMEIFPACPVIPNASLFIAVPGSLRETTPV